MIEKTEPKTLHNILNTPENRKLYPRMNIPCIHAIRRILREQQSPSLPDGYKIIYDLLPFSKYLEIIQDPFSTSRTLLDEVHHQMKKQLGEVTREFMTWSISPWKTADTIQYKTSFGDHSIRWWYLLHKVDVYHGPISLFLNSHELTEDRLNWEFRKCQKLSEKEIHGKIKLNRPDALTWVKEQEIALTLPANTLLMIDSRSTWRYGISSGSFNNICFKGTIVLQG